MKRTLMVLVSIASMGIGSMARAADEPKPDCSQQQAALDSAKNAEKTSGKADLSSCAGMKGQEKKDCETPLRDQAKADKQAAKDQEKAAKMALECCKKPEKKECAK